MLRFPSKVMRQLSLTLTLMCISGLSWANGVSPYLPLQMSPEIEYKIERLFIQANQAIIKRPIPISQVYTALNKIGDSDPALSRSVRMYLERFKGDAGLTHASLSVSNADDNGQYLANKRGRTTDSYYEVSGSAYWAATDWAIVNLGGYAYDDEATLEGSFLSFGQDYLQVDLGFRAHWFGPFQDSDMLITTNAQTQPTITFSNVTPLTDFGINYEIFWGEMSESDLILSQDRDVRMNGKPKLFGFHMSFEPVDGFAIGLNRLMQYGGGDRDESFKDLIKAFFDPSGQDNIGEKGVDFGNQVSSVTSRLTLPGEFPMAVYMEYAGEDTGRGSHRLGNTSLMLGVHMPKLTDTLNLTYEFADWQNAWYVNSNYGDGLRNEGSVIGHWGGNNRKFEDAVGATTHMGKLIWEYSDHQIITTTARVTLNESYSSTSTDYDNGYELGVEYTHGFAQFLAGAQMFAGKDVFGDSFLQATGFLRW
ncbi:capsule assembly Wzi family protein [Echinimonas agarilytica]|uniref:Capsule assembly Wzi family protein n=1 Tax=Echinimonas agarilytica TaxID=1215918 RepID=A0AA41WAE9_9GAMM|nr:capsule assembly Wzi family protein [Echinimonas agarilytica]MCM2680931.1 capsule assembly Wzi family protein [Echinimonas agarilytica]